MPGKKRDELKAGVFVILVVVVTVGVILWMGAAEAFRKAGQRVVFYVPADSPGAGIKEGNSIVIGGKEVGQIDAVEYHPDLGRTLYTGRLNRKDIAIHADGKAIAVAGLVGDASLAVTDLGSEGQPLADKEHPIQITGGVAQAIGDLSAAAGHIRNVLETELNAENPDAVLGKVHTTLNGLSSTAENMASITTNVLAQTDPDVEDSLMAKLHSGMDGIDRLIPLLSDAAEKLSGVLGGMDEMLAKLNAGEGTLGAMLNDPRLYKSVVDAVDEMGLLLKDVREAVLIWRVTGVPLKLK